MNDSNDRPDATERLERSREVLRAQLERRQERAARDFPRSRTMRLLLGHERSLAVSAVALGVLMLRPRWARMLVGAVPIIRALRAQLQELPPRAPRP